MITPTHLSLAVATLGNRARPKDTAWIVWGTLLPDLPMFILFAFDLIRKIPMNEIWDERYFQDYWQIPSNIFNSIPLYLLLLLIGVALKKRGFVMLALAALLHILFDLPVHREDAHAHFYPLSDWKFISPVSYWDKNYYGNIVTPIDMTLCVLGAIFGVRVFVHKWAKILFLVVTLAIPVVALALWFFGLLN